MKMYDEIKRRGKEFVYDKYIRIVKAFKDYEKITKVKMLDAIYNIYSDPNNIIDICTTRELKLLKKLLNNEVINSNKYDWELEQLSCKFLVMRGIDRNFKIPEEIQENVKIALKNVNWTKQREIDDLNEILVSYCKMNGTVLLYTLCSMGSALSGKPEHYVWYHLLNNRLFNYYVYIETQDINALGKNIPVAIYFDYYGLKDEIAEGRKEQAVAGTMTISKERFHTLFYNDFEITNSKIKKMLDEIGDTLYFFVTGSKLIKYFAMLNKDRELLKESLKNTPALKYEDIDKWYKLICDALDEMPSGVLNGLTPNEVKKIKEKEQKIFGEKNKNYKKQTNACLSPQDAKLFYKIYFALLEFTNNKYKIKPSLKIYNQKQINPLNIVDVIGKLWEEKNKIIPEFVKTNPYKFNKEELKITEEFKNGIRNMFIIAKFESEYTAFMTDEKIYMVKGINDNLDNVISYKNLPFITITTIIPFKGYLIYDSILNSYNVNMGVSFNEIIERDYDKLMKCYHL